MNKDIQVALKLAAVDGDSVETRSLAFDTQTLLDEVSAETHIMSDPVNILNYTGFAAMINWRELEGNEAGSSLKLLASLDNLIYAEVDLCSIRGRQGNYLFNVSNAYYKYFKIKYIPNNVTHGNITVKYCIKG